MKPANERPWRFRDRLVQPLVDHDPNPKLKVGCKCGDVCQNDGIQQKNCLFFIARQRGPIDLGPCKCTPGGRTYHDRTGLCLRCEGSGVAS